MQKVERRTCICFKDSDQELKKSKYEEKTSEMKIIAGYMKKTSILTL